MRNYSYFVAIIISHCYSQFKTFLLILLICHIFDNYMKKITAYNKSKLDNNNYCKPQTNANRKKRKLKTDSDAAEILQADSV